MKTASKLIVVLAFVVFPTLLHANPDDLHGKWKVENIIVREETLHSDQSTTIIMEFDREKMIHCFKFNKLSFIIRIVLQGESLRWDSMSIFF